MDKCVYLHKDKDGIVRYVGQGNRERAETTAPSKRTKNWLHYFSKYSPPDIEIVQAGLSVEDATELESALIEKYSETICNIRPAKLAHEIDFDTMNEWFYLDDTCPAGLRWKKQRLRSKKREGDQAGSILTKTTGKLYWQVKVFDHVYKVHRIVFLLANGYIDRHSVVDHIDGNGLNNHPSNLRLVSSFENAHNSKVSVAADIHSCKIEESRRRYYALFKHNDEIFSLKVNKVDHVSDEVALETLNAMLSKKKMELTEQLEELSDV